MYKTVYTSDLNSQEIKGVFLGAKYDDYVRCDHCGSDRIYITNSSTKTVYRCRRCWRHFSLTTNTFLAYTKLPLRLWHEIVWCFVLLTSANKASKILKTSDHRVVLSAYQTIREALWHHSDHGWDGNEKNDPGTYEVDESYFGGKFQNLRKQVRDRLRKQGLAKRGRGAKYRKQPVVGVFRRNGTVYLKPIPSCDKAIIEPVIEGLVPKDSDIYSDTFQTYNNLEALGYVHFTIDHGKKQYVDGVVHINGLEGFWGLSKTNMFVYKGIRKKNWIYYLKEMEFRYNFRNLEYEQRVQKIIRILMRNFD